MGTRRLHQYYMYTITTLYITGQTCIIIYIYPYILSTTVLSDYIYYLSGDTHAARDVNTEYDHGIVHSQSPSHCPAPFDGCRRDESDLDGFSSSIMSTSVELPQNSHTQSCTLHTHTSTVGLKANNNVCTSGRSMTIELGNFSGKELW